MSDTVTLTTEERQEQWLKGLREIVEFLHNHPEAINTYSSLRVPIGVDSTEDLIDRATAIGGKWDKEEGEEYFHLVKHFGEHQVRLMVKRDQVCERVLIGNETVEVPDPNAPKVTITQPVYEWRCPDSLLALAEPSPSEIVPPTDDDDIEPF